MLAAYSLLALALVCSAAIVAGLARGFSGVGGALIFIPLASMVVGPKLAAPVLLMTDAVVAAGLIPRAWRLSQRSDVAFAVVGALAGVPLGTWVLMRLDPVSIRWSIAAIVIVMLSLLMSGWRYRGKSLVTLAVGVGGLAGFFSGVAQLGGPPVLVYWVGRGIPAVTVRANIVMYFAISTVLTAISYCIGGLLTKPAVGLALVTAPFYGLGLLIGSRMFVLASELTFRRVCYVLIAAAAVASLPVWDGLLR